MKAKGRRGARRPGPIWKMVLADLLVLAVALNVFALFHHVLPRKGQAVGLTSQRVSSVARPAESPTPPPTSTPTPAPTPTPQPQATLEAVWLPEASEEVTAAPTPEPTPEPSPTPVMEELPEPERVGDFSERFAGKFTDGEVKATRQGYRSANISIELKREIYCKSRCFIADIYVRDISCFQTVLARDTYGQGYTERLKRIAKRLGSVLLLNGDSYGMHSNGVVIRNGTLYRDDPYPQWDVCVLYWDGTMETFDPRDFDTMAEMERGAYQAWNFGPKLLDADGNAMTKFNTSVGGYCNPRSAVGYYEPGHYCFVVVDGRSSRSRGMTMAELSGLMHHLGCKRAYNLDGGQTTEMVAMTATVNTPCEGGRASSDALAIMELKEG